MANEEHLAVLKQGTTVWNRWREENPAIEPVLYRAILIGLDLSKANLSRAYLNGASLNSANLCGVNLNEAVLIEANLAWANLCRADLREADLLGANLTGGNFSKANLSGALLHAANLAHTDFRGANLRGAALASAHLAKADFSGADLTNANLMATRLLETNFEKANLTGCSVYGVSAWNVNLIGAQQSDLIITPDDEPVITVDNLEVAQFIYLLLHNEKIRQVIDTITSKAVLILGRFTPERKAVLDAIREALRHRNYLPILFDFEAPGSRDFTETISTLAHMARFIVADLTEPSSLPKELEAIVPTLAVPVQHVLEGATRPYSMFQDYWKYQWVLKAYRYESLKELIASLENKVIVPAEAKVQELEEARRAIAEELLKQRPI